MTEPLLSRPWMNVLSNGNWCYVASHLGGGYSFLKNPTVGRKIFGKALESGNSSSQGESARKRSV